MQAEEEGQALSSSGGRRKEELAISVDGAIHQRRELSQFDEFVDDSKDSRKIQQERRSEGSSSTEGSTTEEAVGEKEAFIDDGDEEDDLFFLKRTKSLTGSIKIANSSKSLTIDVEQLVADMSHPVTGVCVKDRKWRLKTYKKCFVGTEAVDWLVNRLEMPDREDAVSVGQELMRLQFFCHVCDEKQEFRDDYLFYNFMAAPRPDKGGTTFIIRSMEELFERISDSRAGVPVTDRKWRFKTYKTCFIGSELVDWMMSHLPLRSRDEAEKIGNKLLNEGYIKHVVDEDKTFQDAYLFYRFSGKRVARRESISKGVPPKAVTIFDFELLKVLGVGAFGKVMMVRKKDTGQVYAMKALDKREVAVSERSIRNLKSERNILRNDHPFLVHLHFSFQTEDKLYLVMDYISGGDMFFHLRRKGRFTEKEAQHFAAEITLALEHLHSYGIIYRDLKPENVLFDKDGHVCLTDFGISKEVGELKTKTLCGTPSYLAPEILRGEEYGDSVDWWSLGVLVLEMVTGRNPFRSKNIHQTMQWIMKKEVVYPDYLESKTIDFISRLLSRDPTNRLGCGATGAREVKVHAFLKGTNWTDLAVKKVKSPFKLHVKNDTDTTYFSSEFTNMSLADELREFTSAALPSSPPAGGDSFADWSHTAPTASLI